MNSLKNHLKYLYIFFKLNKYNIIKILKIIFFIIFLFKLNINKFFFLYINL